MRVKTGFEAGRLRIICLALAALPLFGQTLRVSSSSGKPGDKIAVEIFLDSPATQTPSTLKWEIVFPARLLEMEGAPEVGTAAKDAGKSLTCTQHESYAQVCILAGGHKAITNGPIASFSFRIRSDAHSGSANVSVGKVEAITPDFKTLNLSGGAGRLEVQ